MNRDRDQKLQQKQCQLQDDLAKWALKNGILDLGERLIFELRICKIAVCVGNVLDESKIEPEILLPPDSQDGIVWNLNEEDWDRLSRLPWNPQQQNAFRLLRDCKNGPLHISVLVGRDVKQDVAGGFGRSFNATLKIGRKGEPFKPGAVSYKLFMPYRHERWRGYYAIRKLQRNVE